MSPSALPSLSLFSSSPAPGLGSIASSRERNPSLLPPKPVAPVYTVTEESHPSLPPPSAPISIPLKATSSSVSCGVIAPLADGQINHPDSSSSLSATPVKPNPRPQVTGVAGAVAAITGDKREVSKPPRTPSNVPIKANDESTITDLGSARLSDLVGLPQPPPPSTPSCASKKTVKSTAEIVPDKPSPLTKKLSKRALSKAVSAVDVGSSATGNQMAAPVSSVAAPGSKLKVLEIKPSSSTVSLDAPSSSSSSAAATYDALISPNPKKTAALHTQSSAPAPVSSLKNSTSPSSAAKESLDDLTLPLVEKVVAEAIIGRKPKKRKDFISVKKTKPAPPLPISDPTPAVMEVVEPSKSSSAAATTGDGSVEAEDVLMVNGLSALSINEDLSQAFKLPDGLFLPDVTSSINLAFSHLTHPYTTVEFNLRYMFIVAMLLMSLDGDTTLYPFPTTTYRQLLTGDTGNASKRTGKNAPMRSRSDIAIINLQVLLEVCDALICGVNAILLAKKQKILGVEFAELEPLSAPDAFVLAPLMLDFGDETKQPDVISHHGLGDAISEYVAMRHCFENDSAGILATGAEGIQAFFKSMIHLHSFIEASFPNVRTALPSYPSMVANFFTHKVSTLPPILTNNPRYESVIKEAFTQVVNRAVGSAGRLDNPLSDPLYMLRFFGLDVNAVTVEWDLERWKQTWGFLMQASALIRTHVVKSGNANSSAASGGPSSSHDGFGEKANGIYKGKTDSLAKPSAPSMQKSVNAVEKSVLPATKPSSKTDRPSLDTVKPLAVLSSAHEDKSKNVVKPSSTALKSSDAAASTAPPKNPRAISTTASRTRLNPSALETANSTLASSRVPSEFQFVMDEGGLNFRGGDAAASRFFAQAAAEFEQHMGALTVEQRTELYSALAHVHEQPEFRHMFSDGVFASAGNGSSNHSGKPQVQQNVSTGVGSDDASVVGSDTMMSPPDAKKWNANYFTAASNPASSATDSAYKTKRPVAQKSGKRAWSPDTADAHFVAPVIPKDPSGVVSRTSAALSPSPSAIDALEAELAKSKEEEMQLHEQLVTVVERNAKWQESLADTLGLEFVSEDEIDDDDEAFGNHVDAEVEEMYEEEEVFDENDDMYEDEEEEDDDDDDVVEGYYDEAGNHGGRVAFDDMDDESLALMDEDCCEECRRQLNLRQLKRAFRAGFGEGLVKLAAATSSVPISALRTPTAATSVAYASARALSAALPMSAVTVTTSLPPSPASASSTSAARPPLPTSGACTGSSGSCNAVHDKASAKKPSSATACGTGMKKKRGSGTTSARSSRTSMDATRIGLTLAQGQVGGAASALSLAIPSVDDESDEWVDEEVRIEEVGSPSSGVDGAIPFDGGDID